jgi:hypothetical protein
MSSASSAQSAPKDYKKTAQKYAKKVKTLEEQLKTQEATYDENTKHQTETLKKQMKKVKTLKEQVKTLEEEKEAVEDRLAQSHEFVRSLMEETGLDNSDHILEWVKTQKQKETDNQVQQDALRMFGELQVKFNLLEEQMAIIRRDGFKVSKNKKEKGLSSTHRNEHITQAGHLPVFEPSRCSAMVWSNGKGCQCSRHWDSKQNPDGRDTRLCLTHNKLLIDGVFTGATGLYHQQRPATWGEYGLSVQKEYKEGNSIPWRMKQAEWNVQWNSAEFQASIPEGTPRFPYPEQKVLADVESDDDDLSVISGTTASTQAFSEEQENDVANLADVETPSEEEAVEAPVEEEEEAVVWAKQAQLDRLEQLNKGAMAVDYDILCDLREEKQEWDEEQKGVEAPVEEEEDPEKGVYEECFACGETFPFTSIIHPFGPDDHYCLECAKEAEADQQMKNPNHLADSDEEQ